MSVLVETSLGVFVVDLYCSERPRTSLNFIKLCKLKYYNFSLFHTVQKNLVAQVGDPTGTGRGGFSYFHHLYGEQAKFFDAERDPKISHASKGLISMIDNGSGQHGSQFFITLNDDLNYLDDKHTVFGYVAEGFDFINKINDVYCDNDNRPYRNVRIHHTVILYDPFEDNINIEYPESPKRFFNNLAGLPRIEEDEKLDEEEDISPDQINEIKLEQESKTHAQLLTLIGDLPDTDVKPPENVLFVCKLNPVTSSEDLEIIFSRFGEIVSCEVIRDVKSGASLQYAFIEFKNEKDCENAFFKMDKVVIDDRRIHVDFSQSVANEWHNRRLKQLNSTNKQPVTKHTTNQHRNYSSTKDKNSYRDSGTSDLSTHKKRDINYKRLNVSSKKKKMEQIIDDYKIMGDEFDLVISDSESSSDVSFNKRTKGRGDGKKSHKSSRHHHSSRDHKHHKSSSKKKHKHSHKHKS